MDPYQKLVIKLLHRILWKICFNEKQPLGKDRELLQQCEEITNG